ncbi:MAG TPA: SPOR domain-containing protein [Hyphomicrobiaceae bacterium]|nr:SPOR domain-containing protein [Hyphomicrobiaceae bacterium]
MLRVRRVVTGGQTLMAGHWLRLTLAGLAAAVVVLVCNGVAAAPKKAAPAAAKSEDQPDADDGKSGPAKKSAKKKQDPAEASRAIEQAVKLLEAGKSEQAAQALSTVIGGGNLPPPIMAKALLYRGIAYRQQNKPTQAIADLTSALWLKGGLAEPERKDALRQRASAYQEAGLSDTGEPVAPAMPSAGTRTASASGLSEDGSPSAAAPPKESSGWSFGNPFSSLFGGGSSSSEQQPTPPATTASIEPARSPPRPAISAWSSSTEVRGGGNTVTASTPAPAAASPPPSEGRFRIQIAMVRTQAEAQALATRVKQEHAALLGNRETQIDEAVVGNMGSFYRIRIGPFASAQEGQAACVKLKGPGIDCLLVTQ